MKKLLAIFLSVLMLCTMIPFASVSAADEPTIVVSTVESANAGDEIEVQVNLLNNPGVIAATVRLEYDPEVMELVTYYDEDEEDYFSMIEVGSGFNASSNKYITLSPVSAVGFCTVSYIRGTAKNNCTNELFFTATFKIKDDAVSGEYPLTISYNPANFFNVEGEDVAFGKQDTSITINGSEPPTIAVSTVESAEAGEEIEVEVNLLNNPGVIAATVRLEYDPEVMELVTYYDEDEEDYLSMIEVGSGFNASSNKYITLSPVGAVGFCTVSYIRGTAKNNCTNELFFTATFKIKDDAVSGEYPLTIVYDPANFFNVAGEDVVFGKLDSTIVINGADPACEHEYEYDCDKNCKLCGEETRPEAEHVYLYACATHCNSCGEKTNPRAHHTIVFVEAKEPISCIEFGNRQYWTCSDCGNCWLDEDLIRQSNMMSVMIAGECISNAAYACQDGECINCSLPVAAEVEHEYPYACTTNCAICGELNSEAVEHSIVHIPAVEPTNCLETGNVEFWTCEICGGCWLDADCTIATTMMDVKTDYGAHAYEAVVTAPDCLNGGYTTYTCSACGDSYVADNTDATGHDYKAVVTAPDCENNGYTTYTCSACGDSYTDNITSALGHSYAYDCSANCSVCGGGEREANHEYFDACDPVCLICNEITREVAHNIVHVAAVENVDCQTMGNLEHWYCDICGAAWLDEAQTMVTTLKSVRTGYGDHNYEAVITAPDCVNGGYTTYTCSACGDSYVDDYTDATGHNYEAVITAPDCVNGGYTTYTCSACGDSYVADNTDATGHNYEAVVTAPDCENDGYTTYTCSVCGDSYTDDVTSALGHSYAYDCSTNCSVCGGGERVAEHEYFDACDPICLICNEITREVAHNVVYVAAVENVDCKTMGNVEHWYCDACGAAWLDEAQTMITTLKSVLTGYGEHTYDDDFDVDCNICGEIRKVAVSIEIITADGTSVSEVNNSLAFRFAVKATDASVEQVNKYVAGSANVTPFDNGVAYKLVRMGSIVSIQADAVLDIEHADGRNIINSEAVRLYSMDAENGEMTFATRVINIPNVGKKVPVSCRAYYVYEQNGIEVIVYGDTVTTSYAAAAAQ